MRIRDGRLDEMEIAEEGLIIHYISSVEKKLQMKACVVCNSIIMFVLPLKTRTKMSY